MSVPNQKTIVCDTWEGQIPNGVTFSTIIHSINDGAMSMLTPNGYKLYMYFYCNKKGFELELSPVAVKGKTSMGKAAYDSAVRELIDKGFLSLIRGNKYQFSIKPASRPVGRKPVDRKPDNGQAPSPDNHITRSTVSGGPSPDNHITRSTVSGGEIYTDTYNILTNSNIGVYPSESDNNVARERTNNVDDETLRNVAFAMITQSGWRHTPESYRGKLRAARNMLSNKAMTKEFADIPIWQYMCFESEDAFYNAVEKGRPDAVEKGGPQILQASQLEDIDDELPF